ncbi:hypothetical protein KZZ20_02460 [Methylacidiphilum fumariolicum]|nr:hypothetical protein [Candidatus Methylacidiphilum fumarolicum]MBW6414390.1 hypothetical protein [Candidatus Methylacidiphilum fumarolicum]
MNEQISLFLKEEMIKELLSIIPCFSKPYFQFEPIQKKRPKAIGKADEIV